MPSSHCPRCGDTRLAFNRAPWRQYDEGDLFVCAGCELNGESKDLIDIPDLDGLDPEHHPYIGNGTHGCVLCQYPMNAHLDGEAIDAETAP